MLTAIGFILVNLISYSLAYIRGPFWGLLAYVNIYFNSPQEHLNWWASYLPFDRWSLLTSFVLISALIIHRKKLANHKLSNTVWTILFYLLSAVIAWTSAIDKDDALHFLYIIFTYCLIIYIMLKSIKDIQDLRLFFLAILILATNLSIDAYLNGKRINARLEMVGTADAFGSNEFSLLLAAIIPLIFVFVKNGTKYERGIALLSMPFILNAFVLCNSRGSTVAFAGGIVAASAVAADKQVRKGLLVILMVTTPAFLYLTDAEFIERFSTLFSAESAIDDEEQANELSSGRTEIWHYGLLMAEDHPLGVGPNGFKKLARYYMPDTMLTIKPGAEYGVRSAHNTYLQILVEQGILGLGIWIAMCLHTCLILRKSFNINSKLINSTPFLKDCTFALNIAVYSILIGGMVNSRVYFEYFWWLLALAAITFSLSQELLRNEKITSR